MQDAAASSSCTEWFRSYLSGRQQVVRINSALSEPLPLVSGIPQGSILAPLLLSIYTNDLTSVPMKCMAKSYVDDTKLLTSFDLKEKTPTIAHIEESSIGHGSIGAVLYSGFDLGLDLGNPV